MSTTDDSPATMAHFRGRTVLITGAFGFIGTWISTRLAAAGANVMMLHRRSIAHAVPSGATAIPGDLLDHGLWDRILPGVDVVFHLAAQTSAKRSERDPIMDRRLNVEATSRMLDACWRSGGAVDVVFAGTTTQHGKPAELPLKGDEPDRPITFHDLHKLVAEQGLEFYARRGTIRATSLRLPTVYGPGAYESSPDCGVVNAMVRAALAGQTLTIYGQGDRLRDFVHVEDAARAFLHAASALERCNARHFLLGSGAPLTVKEAVHRLAAAVERELGARVPIVHVEPPADELEIAKCSFSADPAPFEQAANFRLKWSYGEGIQDTVRYFKQRSTSEIQRRK